MPSSIASFLLFTVGAFSQISAGHRFLNSHWQKRRPASNGRELGLDFRPETLGGIFIDDIDESKGAIEEQLLESAALDSIWQKPLDTPSGVLCQTLLHPAVHDKHFLAFAESGLGADLARRFDAELQAKCKAAFTPQAYQRLWTNYTGSWKFNSVAPHDEAIFGAMGAWLNRERQKTHAEAETWNKFRNQDTSDVSGTEKLLHIIAEKAHPASALSRVLDFGCGDGIELSKISRGLGLGRDNTFCLDVVDYVSEEVQNNVTRIVVPPAATSYGPALEGALTSHSLRGTVSAVVSTVTFHHIKTAEMRRAAISFIRESLTSDGFFLMAEWDNPRTPIDYTIYMDLSHYLPDLFFHDTAPSAVTLTPLDTEYLSVAGWTSLMASNGLSYDAARSSLPWTPSGNETLWLKPKDAADQSSGRNFLEVFRKAQTTTP